MTEDRKRVLNMLAEGKITADEADALLDAMAATARADLVPVAAAPTAARTASATGPKYLRVLVEGVEEGKPSKVNVRVPFDLIRAGMRLAALIPAVAYDPVNRALKENGIDMDISKIKPENLEDMVAHLQELQVDVDDGTEKVRVFCE